MSATRREAMLDPRAWAIWAAAAMSPVLFGRNPWPLLVVLLAVIAVRVAWSPQIRNAASWRFFLRIALIFTVVSVVFNVLTVRAGDHVIGHLPEWLPLIGGEITLNALVFGILSGTALITLVLIGSTISGLLDWAMIVRLLPPGLTSIAVAGSIAFSFIPQTAIAYREIREAQLARGHRVRGARDLLPIIMPMIAGGLERSLTLAESMESRGFGGGDAVRQPSSFTGYLTAFGLASGAVASYLLATGRVAGAGVVFAAGAACALTVIRLNRDVAPARTRYRQPNWRRQEWIVSIGSGIAFATTIAVLVTKPRALRYEPYPHIDVPFVSLALLIGLLGLLAPLVVAPASGPR